MKSPSVWLKQKSMAWVQFRKKFDFMVVYMRKPGNLIDYKPNSKNNWNAFNNKGIIILNLY